MANPRHSSAVVRKIVSHSAGVFSVWLVPDRAVPRFKVGQFLHLALDPYSPEGGYWPESRVFSIASAPGGDALRIVYSVKGHYTSRMSAELVEGKEVWLKYPFGDFLVDTGRPERTVLIAGGTGISPFVGLLGRTDRLDSVWLYYGVRTPDHLIFSDELQRAFGSGMNLEVSIETPGGSSKCPLPSRAGPLDIEAIRRRHESERSAQYYLSGPPGMINAFKSRLIGAAVAAANIHIDAWE